MRKPVPPRIALYPAAASPVVVAILRVRSKWWHVIRIDQLGVVEHGSWFHGAKIMLEECSLNHDGTLFAYVATADAYGGWSGLCRPPWLRCLAQVREPIPFGAPCAFGFGKPGEVSLLPQEGTAAFSEEDQQTLDAMIQRMVGVERGREIKEKMSSDKTKQSEDWERSAITIRKELRMRMVQSGGRPDRMAKQGFVLASGGWTWTGRDGVARTVAGGRCGESDLATLDSLNCCVDASGRWWQALDGVITCHAIEKTGALPVFSIDTRSWTPPLRNIHGKEP